MGGAAGRPPAPLLEPTLESEPVTDTGQDAEPAQAAARHVPESLSHLYSEQVELQAACVCLALGSAVHVPVVGEQLYMIQPALHSFSGLPGAPGACGLHLP